ncbi:hypothetical protein ACVW1B_005408 [Bradyrhizobium sp. USDA 4502]
MGYGLYVLSPARLGFFVTVFATTCSRPAKRHLPLGRQACTISPSASCALVSCAIGVHRISTHVRDDREAPLVSGETAASIALGYASDKAKYFRARGLTGFAELPVGLFCRTPLHRHSPVRNCAPEGAPPGASLGMTEREWARASSACPHAPTSRGDRRGVVRRPPRRRRRFRTRQSRSRPSPTCAPDERPGSHAARTARH